MEITYFSYTSGYIIGALGSVPSDLEETLLLIGLDKWILPVLQKTVLLGTCQILRHYLTHSAIK